MAVPATAASILFAAAIALPTAALLVRVIAQGAAPSEGFTFSARQGLLLWRSTWTAAAATVLCILTALPCVPVLARSGRCTGSWPLAATMMGVLVCPPMIYAFGWAHLLPATLPPEVRCIGVWCLWAWPIPAMALAAGWIHAGRQAYEAAVLAVTPTQATLRVALPALRRHLALAALLLFLLFFNDHGVPHACAVIVYATELLGWASSSSRPIDILWPALPAVVATLITLAALARVATRASHDSSGGEPATLHRGRGSAVVVAAVYALVTFVLPIGAFTARLTTPQALADAFAVYARDLLYSLGVAALSGCLVAATAAGLCWNHRVRRLAAWWSVGLGALPGGLVAVMLICAYAAPAGSFLYDDWPILVLSALARFGWLGMAAVTFLLPPDRDPLTAQARTDGATPGVIAWRVHLPVVCPALLGVAVCAAAWAIAEVPASSLLRPPTFSPIALLVIEKFHRFETDMLIALGLWLVAGAVCAAAVLSWLLRRRARMAPVSDRSGDGVVIRASIR
ncbi:MAG: hypothetical protein HY763_11295 [Planctomycetes bacterium]|nr:hypothetical protein [Planctomycetota bacterium]